MADDPRNSTAIRRLILGIATAMAVIASVAFIVTRAPLEWPLGGIYLRIMAATVVANVASVLIWNPKLIARRAWPGGGTKTWDVVSMAVLAPTMISVFIVAGLDARDWASRAPSTTWLLGLAMHVIAWGAIIWSQIVNPFFEKTVRIQTNHNHRVIDSGPYRFVRHPGLAVVGFVVRTTLEDRVLQEELPGYADYASRTRLRLIPGVW